MKSAKKGILSKAFMKVAVIGLGVAAAGVSLGAQDAEAGGFDNSSVISGGTVIMDQGTANNAGGFNSKSGINSRFTAQQQKHQLGTTARAGANKSRGNLQKLRNKTQPGFNGNRW